MNVWLENMFLKTNCAVFDKNFELLCNFSKFSTCKWQKRMNKSPSISRGITVAENHVLDLYIRDRPKINQLKPDCFAK